MKKLFLGIILLLAGVGGIGYCIYTLNSKNFNQKKNNVQNSKIFSSQALQCKRSLKQLKKLNSEQLKKNKKLLNKIEQLKNEEVEIEFSDTDQQNDVAAQDSVKTTDEQKTDDDSDNKPDKNEISSKNNDSEQKKKEKEKKKRPNYIMVYYAKGKEDVSSRYKSKIRDFADSFKDHRFRIGVRTGDSDNLKKNKRLARHRSRKLKALLNKAGVAKKDIKYRIFPGNPAKKSDKPYSSSFWRRARIKAFSKGDR